MKKMDKDVTRWIVEFLLRQPIPKPVAAKIVSNVHVPINNDNDNLRLKRTILLRSIELEMAKGSVSEAILDYMEILEKLDRNEGLKVPLSIKVAYCAVALECTVKFLGKKASYLDAVKRVWRERVAKLEDSQLLTAELRDLGDKVEAAVWDSVSANRLLARNTRDNAFVCLRAYLGEALALIGPPFLQLLAKKQKEAQRGAAPTPNDSNNNNQPSTKEIQKNAHTKDKHASSARRDREPVNTSNSEALDLFPSQNDIVSTCEVNKAHDALKPSSMDLQGAVKDPLSDALHLDEGIQKNLQSKHKHVASLRRPRGPVRIFDSDEFDVPSSQYDSVPSPEVNKAREALKSSSLELQAVVKDPLPDALSLAEKLIAEMAKNLSNQQTSVENQIGKSGNEHIPSVGALFSEIAKKILTHEPAAENHNGRDANTSDPSANQISEPAQTKEGNAELPSCSHQNAVRKTSLMERNSTACTYEWEDSIDGSPEQMNRIRLKSPKRKAVSPLKKHEITKFARRRKMKRWSLEEEDALREGVQKFGKGNWKLILNFKRDVFEERTEVDLKDKWRNMTRY